MRFSIPRRRTDEERILPLINVVFLLLVFFMLAGRLSASDPFEVDPAQSASNALAGESELLILVGVEGQLALNGRQLDAAALRQSVADILTASGPDAAPSVRLKADGRADATRIVEVMQLLHEAGVRRLNLLTVPELR